MLCRPTAEPEFQEVNMAQPEVQVNIAQQATETGSVELTSIVYTRDVTYSLEYWVWDETCAFKREGMG